MTNQKIREIRYGYKVVVSGGEIEIYSYRMKQYKAIKEDDESESEDKDKMKSDKETKPELPDPTYKRDAQNVRKMKVKVRRLINANAFQHEEKDKFITLTFGGDMPTRERVVECFKNFNKRLKRHFKDDDVDYKYIAVIERGEKGTKRLHLHVLFFGLPFIKTSELSEIWKYGFVKVNAVENYFDLANYIVKYVEKTLEDGSYIPKGKRFYFPSRGLKKPNELFFVDDDMLEEFLEKNCADKTMVFETSFTSDYCGDCHYMKYSKPRKFIPKFDDETDLLFYLDEMTSSDA